MAQFPLGQRVALPGHFLEPVTLEAVRFIGSRYECRGRLGDGTPDEAILSLEEAAALAGQVVTKQASIQPVEAEKLRLLVESARIRLAYAHDRQFAVSLAGYVGATPPDRSCLHQDVAAAATPLLAR